MMCEQYEEQLSSLIDNELEDEKSESLFRHMSSCPECRQSLRVALQMRVDLKEGTPPLAPRELDRKILISVPQAQRYLLDRKPLPSSMWRRRVSLPYPIAAAVSVFLIAASITLSLVWSKSERIPSETSVQTVYVTALPAVEIQGHYVPPKTSIQ